jgi:hypothetical protein
MKLSDKILLKTVRKVFDKKGYVYFEGNNYDLNIIAIRNSNTNQSLDAFDDLMLVAYKDEYGNPHLFKAKCTTDPGKLELIDPTFEAAKQHGTAIIAEQQVRGCYALGNHGVGNWRHEALIQVKPMEYYRDNNRNEVLDYVNKMSMMAGTNIHASSLLAEEFKIGRYSAGCIAFAIAQEYFEFISLCKKQIRFLRVNSFTFTLLNELDLY